MKKLIVDILLILAGLVLLTGLLGAIPALGDHLEKFARWLGSFQGIIGIVALVVGIWKFSISLSPIMLIIAGIMLGAGILQTLPAVGDHLDKLARWLGSFQTIIGIITLLVGIYGLVF